MLTQETPAAEVLPPHAQLIQMTMSYWPPRMLYVAAKLGLADRLASGAQSADTLAGQTGTHAPSLYRMLRALASLGVFTEQAGRRFALTPLGEALRSDAPGAAHATILTMGSDWIWRALEQFPYSIETGKTGFEKALGEPIFDWLAKRPEEASLFSQTMIGVHGMEPAAVAEAYDFRELKTVVDVGGGSGNLLTTILQKQPGPRGVLFDLPHVVDHARPLIESRGLADRVSIETGSFFEKVPAGGDAYLLSHIIHDWTEELCLRILGNCRKVMGPASKLLIIEMVLPPGDTFHPGKMLDMTMLLVPGGQERSEQEYKELLAKAGFELTRVVPTQSPVSVVEAVPAAA
jgi:hypothetical protein